MNLENPNCILSMTDEIIAERLLSVLRDTIGSRLDYNSRPILLGEGSDAWIYAFDLSSAPAPFDRQLVLRLLRPEIDANQVHWESGVHVGLAKLGFPVPRIVYAQDKNIAFGTRFQIMERVPGRMLLGELFEMPINALLRRPLLVSKVAIEALGTAPRLLAEIQARLHDLPTESVERELAGRGFSADTFTEKKHLNELINRVRSGSFSGLEPVVAWLLAEKPQRSRISICHSDLVFSNLHVQDGRVCGVFDWTKMVLGDPAYDVAATLARLRSSIPGIPLPLRLVQSFMSYRYLACYRKRRYVDDASLNYYEVFWTLHELLWGVERRAKGQLPSAHIRERWLHPAVLANGLRRLSDLTQTKLSLPTSPGIKTAQ